MKRGKHICETLRAIRLDIARANGIKYFPRVCHHEGDCAGTCPACESEVRYLEREIARKRRLGKAAVVAGVSLGLMSVTATSCDFISQSVQRIVQHGDDESLLGEIEAITPEMYLIKAEQYTMQSDKRIIESELGEGPKAVFPGGEGALFKFIKEHFICPEGVDDTTYTIIELWIDIEGNAYDPYVSEYSDSTFVAEALRVTKLLPKFEPARDEDGTVFESRYYLLFDAKKLGPDK